MKIRLTLLLTCILYALSGTTFSSAQEVPDVAPFKKISVGVFVQPDHVIGSGHFWKDTKTGAGITQNLGFGVKGDYYLNEKSALSLSIGAAEWTLTRN